MEENPLLDEILSGVELEDAPNPYAGKHGEAVLEEVGERAVNEYGYSMTLKFDLLGIGGGRPFTTTVFLPSGANGSEKAQRSNEISKDRLTSLLHAGHLIPQGKKWPNVSDDENYAKLVALFRSGIGRNFPLEIRARKTDVSRVDVWGRAKRS